MSRLGVAVWAFLVLTGLAFGAPGAGHDHSTRAATRSANPGAALPESLLARVGAGRAISVHDLVETMNLKTVPPDSLTPDAVGRFLDLLIDRELLAEAAGAEPWAWTPPESASYRALRDRLSVRAALDSALAQARDSLRRSGGEAEDPVAVGIAARDRAIAGMAVAFDESLVVRLAQAWAALPRPSSDSSLAAQLRALRVLPRLDPADTSRVVARSLEGDYGTVDLLDAWRRLSPAYRPRVSSADEIRDLVRNGLFERALRRQAASQRLDLDSGIAASLARARDGIAVAHYLEREVVEKIRPDSLAIRRFYVEHRDTWSLPLRGRLLRLAANDRVEATRTALRLRDAAQAESLTALARRLGLDYVSLVTERSDSALFRQALHAGAGAVLGPERRGDEWWVARVLEFLPAADRPLEEIWRQVEERWRAETSERQTRLLCSRLRKRIPVTFRGDAWERVRAAVTGR